MSRNLRIAWFSPLLKNIHGYPSLASYATKLLIPELKKHFSITIFTDQPKEGVSRDGDIDVYHYLRAYKIHEENPFQLFFYQIEDSKVTNFCRHHLGLIPGITWFHSYLLLNRPPEALSHTPWEEVIKWVKAKSQQGATATSELPTETIWVDTNNPMPSREFSLSFNPLFSQAWFVREYNRLNLDKLSDALDSNFISSATYLPLPVADNTGNLSFKPNTWEFTIGLVGNPAPESRYFKILQAFAESEYTYKLIWFVSKECRDSADRLTNNFLAPNSAKSISIVCYNTFSELKEWLKEVSLLFLLKFSVFGTRAPILQLAASQGVPLAITDFAEGEFFPTNLFFNIPLGDGEQQAISSAIAEVYSDSDNSIKRAKLQSYVKEEFALNVVAEQLKLYLLEQASLLSPLYATWFNITKRLKGELITQYDFPLV
jgi:hypothetical protein